MSGLMVLLTGSTETAPGTPVTPPAQVTGAPPAPTDSTSLMMQPVWDYSVNVGPTRSYQTLEAGIAAARSMPLAKAGAVPNGGSLNVLARGGRPEFARTVITLDPGTYNLTDILDAGDGIDIVGLGTSRDDVVIRTTTARYNLRFWGSMYLANVKLHHDEGATGNNYCFHGSTASGTRDFTAVFDNVSFYDTNTASYGIAGWDIPPGMHAVFYKCRFQSTTGHGINFHDMPGNDGFTFVFLKCASDVEMKTGYAYATNKGDTWVVDCTKLDGTPIASTRQTDVAAAVPTTDPPPLVTAGMSAAENAKYYPTKLGAAATAISPAYPDTASVTLTAGRTYYVPLPPLPWSALVGKAQAIVNAAAGTVSAGLYLQTTTAAKPDAAAIWSTARSAVAGAMDYSVPASYSPLFLDRGMKLWLGVRVSSASCTVQGSLNMAAQTACWYEDGVTGADVPTWPGTTLTQVPSGDPVPWAAMVTG